MLVGTGWICDWPHHQGANSFRNTDPVYGCPTVVQCNWGLCATCYTRCEGAFQRRHRPDTEDLLQRQAQPVAGERPFHTHFTTIQLLNQLFSSAFPFADLTQTSPLPGSLTHLLLKYRGLFYEAVKMGVLSSALDATAQGGQCAQFDLVLSRSRAFKHAQTGQPDRDARHSVFAQAFRVMHGLPPIGLRRADKLYNTKFAGEHAVDGGGPYRYFSRPHMHSQTAQPYHLPSLCCLTHFPAESPS